MNLTPRLSRLEALLERVRRRASEPRKPAPANVSPAAPAKPSAPPVVAAPPAAAPSWPAAAPSPATAPPAAAPVAPATFVPPAAPPIAAVARETAAAPAPPPASGTGFAMPEPPPISEPFAAAPPPVAPAATMRSGGYAANELEVVDTPPPESLGEEDVIDEIPSDMLESIPPSGGVAASDQAEEEEPPVSSQRPRALMELDDALTGAEAESMLDEGREVPLKTPPPESGPQAAPLPAGIAAPATPDVDGLLEADLAPPAPGPTPEQLGQTIDLEESRGPTLELATAPPTPAPPAPPEELEIALPTREAAGRFSEELVSPPEARGDLSAHLDLEVRRELEAQRSQEAEELAASERPAAESAPPPSDAVSEPHLEAAAEAPQVEVIGRPRLESGTIIRAERARPASPRPSTFIELLDSSITLGG